MHHLDASDKALASSWVGDCEIDELMLGLQMEQIHPELNWIMSSRQKNELSKATLEIIEICASFEIRKNEKPEAIYYLSIQMMPGTERSEVRGRWLACLET